MPRRGNGGWLGREKAVTFVGSRGLPVAGFGSLGDEDLARLGVTLRGMGEGTWREREENKVRRCCLEKTAHDAMRHGALRKL